MQASVVLASFLDAAQRRSASAQAAHAGADGRSAHADAGAVARSGQRARGRGVPVPLAVAAALREVAMSDAIPAIKVLLLPKHTNVFGTIFGGVILSYIDLASAVEARKAGRTAT